jgi:hypothetical protein
MNVATIGFQLMYCDDDDELDKICLAFNRKSKDHEYFIHIMFSFYQDLY